MGEQSRSAQAQNKQEQHYVRQTEHGSKMKGGIACAIISSMNNELIHAPTFDMNLFKSKVRGGPILALKFLKFKYAMAQRVPPNNKNMAETNSKMPVRLCRQHHSTRL